MKAPADAGHREGAPECDTQQGGARARHMDVSRVVLPPERVLPQESILAGSGFLSSPVSLVTLTYSPVQR